MRIGHAGRKNLIDGANYMHLSGTVYSLADLLITFTLKPNQIPLTRKE